LSLLISMNYFLAVFQLPKLKKEKSNKTELVVSTYNIQGFGYGQIDLTVQLLSDFMKEKKVDILCFQEFGFSENFTADSIKQRFKFLPYQVITGNEKAGFGMAIFSKYPIVRSTIIRLKQRNVFRHPLQQRHYKSCEFSHANHQFQSVEISN